MKLKQLSTSSSSSDTNNGGGRRPSTHSAVASPPASPENLISPPTAEIPPSHSGFIGPLPYVDPAYMKRVDSILRSFPTDTDPAAVYTALKAHLGISRSKDPATSSRPRTENPSAPPTSHTPNPTSQNSPPTLPKTNSPIQPSPSPTAQPSPFSPTFSPIQLAQCSGDISDKEEEWMAYEQPFVIPSPASGGSPTPVHEPSLTEAGCINNEEVENFHPSVADREAEGNILHFDEGEPEKEEGPPRRRTRRMTNDQLLEAAAVMRTDRPTREEVPEVQRPRVRRSILDEVDEEVPAYQEAGEAVDEREATEDSLVREKRERKRKGKESVLPPPKRNRPASQGIVFIDTDQPTPPREDDECSDTEGTELLWTRSSRWQGRC